MASKATKNVFCQFYLVVKLNLKAKNPMRVKLVSGGSVINEAYLVYFLGCFMHFSGESFGSEIMLV